MLKIFEKFEANLGEILGKGEVNFKESLIATLQDSIRVKVPQYPKHDPDRIRNGFSASCFGPSGKSKPRRPDQNLSNQFWLITIISDLDIRTQIIAVILFFFPASRRSRKWSRLTGVRVLKIISTGGGGRGEEEWEHNRNATSSGS